MIRKGLAWDYEGADYAVSFFDSVTGVSDFVYHGPKWLEYKEEIDTAKIQVSDITNASYLFADWMLTDIDLSGFDTSRVTDMSGMFLLCV